MNSFLGVIETPGFTLFLIIILIMVIILSIINFIKLNKMKNRYEDLMKIIGGGKDFNEMLHGYIYKVDTASDEIQKLKKKTENIQKNLEKCVQKVGMVRYNAFLDSGSELCFAIALLDFEDNGVVINGIYSRDNTTTTYAKPIEHGKSKYALVKEEEAAIEKAMHNAYKCYLDLN